MKKATRLEAPEGGWGILVCFGLALPFICGMGFMLSFGLIFADFLKSIGAETGALATITSACYAALSISGLFTSSLSKKYSLRSVGLVGALVYVIGSVMQIYVTSTFQLIVAFGLMQGAALGLIVPIAYTVFNNYFVKKRVMMMAFSQSIIGVGIMFYPVVVQKLSEWYGFRGCLIILAAVNSHTILGMLIMQPVEWHMKRVQVVDEELKNAYDEEPKRAEPLLKGSSQNSLAHNLNMALSSRRESIASLSAWTAAIVVSDASVEKQVHPKSASYWQAVVDFLDLTLVKDPIYLNIVLGISFALYSDLAFFTLQPFYLFELNYTKEQVANIIAIGAGADLGSRVFLAVSSIFFTVPSRHVYFAGAFFTVITRFVFFKVFDFTRMAILTALMGFLRTWVHVPTALVFAEFLPKERFASGYGLYMFIHGIIAFAIGPAVGYLRDKTRNYVLTFHCINFFMALCALQWIIEMVYLRFRRQQKNTIKQQEDLEMKCEKMVH